MRAFEDLMRHEPMIRKFRECVSKPFAVKSGEATVSNLWRIMLLDVQSGSGPSLDAHRVSRVRESFSNACDLAKLRDYTSKKKFEEIYRNLTGLRVGFGPKITAVFMRRMVCEYSIFPELEHHLFLPVDVHIKTILVKRLRAFRAHEVSEENPFERQRARLFQDAVGRIHSPRVELDAFWHVGYLFCSKKSRTVCGDLCWIRDHCQEKTA